MLIIGVSTEFHLCKVWRSSITERCRREKEWSHSYGKDKGKLDQAQIAHKLLKAPNNLNTPWNWMAALSIQVVIVPDGQELGLD
ncbi:hypothetical protein Tco_1109863 [Tanacetum coccineum]|uniref:Uncharacterized protein n=1 Tax=Tanacetum coccineum TaxID=301880 RepID=A0ABQ5IIJ3_9ASTR